MADELENLIVRISAENAQYVQAIEQSAAKTAVATEAMTRQLGGVESAITRLGGVAGGVLSTVGGFIATVGATGWLEKSLNSYIKAESGALKLRAAIEATGRSADPVIKDYLRFAESIAEVTVTSKGSALAMLQQAESLGLQDDAAKRAVKNAVALAAAKGGEAEGYLRVAALVESGNTMLLGRFLPTLRGIQDEGQRAAEAQRLLGAMFNVAKAEGSSLGGQIEHLNKAYEGLNKQFGPIIAEFVKPVVEGLKFSVAWFAKLSYEMKTAIVVVVGLAAAAVASFTVITGAITLAGIVFNSAFGGVGIVVGLIVTGLAAVAGAAAGLVVTFGGIGAVMQQVKAKAIEAWEWLKPVRQAVASFFGALWDVAKETFENLKGVAIEVWNAIAATFNINFTEIRDGIRDAFIYAEFVVRNWREYWDLAIRQGQLSFLVWVEEQKHFWFTVLPYALSWFSRNWKETFEDAGNLHQTVMRNLVRNAVVAGEKIFAALSGEDVDWGKGWVNMLDGFKSRIQEMPKIPARVMGEAEIQLRGEIEATLGRLGIQFNDFWKKKLEEFARPDGVAREAEQAGELMGKALSTGVGKSMEGFEAVATRSAEALSRVTAYRENTKPENYLKEIRDLLKEQNKKPGVNLNAPGLEG